MKECKKDANTDITGNVCALGKLKHEVENAKRTHSSQQSDGNDFSETLTHAMFQELNVNLFCRTVKPVELVFKDASIIYS